MLSINDGNTLHDYWVRISSTFVRVHLHEESAAGRESSKPASEWTPDHGAKQKGGKKKRGVWCAGEMPNSCNSGSVRRSVISQGIIARFKGERECSYSAVNSYSYLRSPLPSPRGTTVAYLHKFQQSLCLNLRLRLLRLVSSLSLFFFLSVFLSFRLFG